MAIIHSLVEGPTDEAAARRLIEATGHSPGITYGKKGGAYIQRKIGGFNRTAKSMYYLAMVDFMDTRSPCPAEVIRTGLPNRQPKMLLRIVVRELESWVLADRRNVAKFLNIDISMVPGLPEGLSDPKRELVNLAARSTSQRIRSALAAEDGSHAVVGKLYTSELIRFIRHNWDVAAARKNAPSLDHSLKRLEEIPLVE